MLAFPAESSLPDCLHDYPFDCLGGKIEKGKTYIGELKKGGVYHGFGKLKINDWEEYTGYFKDGLYHGNGSLSFGYVEKYAGGFKDGLYHGDGSFTFEDGAEYIGVFAFGKANGEGVLISANLSTKEGEWKNNIHEDGTELSITAPMRSRQSVKPKTVPSKPRYDSSKIVSASSGSGFSVSLDGFVITNNHVINGCNKVFIHANNKKILASIITYDKQNDLALLKADFKPEAVFPLSASRPELLQDIYVAGYPFGMNLSTSVKVTKGIISSLTGIENNFSEIQIDAALQSGNSGGPILDEKGNVVGVAVSKLDVKYALKNFGAIPENTNFGIKSIVVGSILDSNGVNIPQANKKPISKSQLGKQISKGTYYISCWMTMAQIEKMRTQKVMFSDLD
ncbi:trypsin-like peptidase domain-containing protein [Alphaproteobacteria bacterium]|nr:trypsin-like peptidase domain-containing protein [Alphaproteobacteria bacterium]